MKRISVKQTVIAAMLTALSLIIAVASIKLPLPAPFSITIASHVPTIIAMFISPWVAICTVLGSTLGFLISLGPVVALRAASHIFFVLCGTYWLKKNWNAYLVLFLTSLIHALGEAVVSLVFGPMFGFNIAAPVSFTFIPFIAQTFGPVMDFVINIVFVMTALHHFVDSIISVCILIPLERAGIIANTRLLPYKDRSSNKNGTIQA